MAALALLVCETQAVALEVQVIQTSPASLHANITLVKGEKAAVLIDAPFTRADALRVAAAILESGKTLETIYITHDHPDHFFSVDAIAEQFPNARILAAPDVVDDIWKSIPLKMKRWGPLLGQNGPRHFNAPIVLQSNYFELEGHRLEVLGPMQGDHAHATAVWIPDAQALIAGDLLFNKVHLWLGEMLAPGRAEWLRSVDKLAALGAKIVVAGHKKVGLPDDASAIAFTHNYLQAFERAIPTAKNSADLAAKLHAQFPDTVDELDDFILGNSTKVAMGETPPWQE